MDPDVHPDWYYDPHNRYNAEVKPRPSPLIRDFMYGPAYYSTHDPFIGHNRPAMMSSTRPLHRRSRLCDHPLMRAGKPLSDAQLDELREFHEDGEDDEDDEYCEAMRVDSYEDYPSYSNLEPKPHSSQEEIKFEAPARNSLDAQKETSDEAVKGKVETFFQGIKDQILEMRSIYPPEEVDRACKIFIKMVKSGGFNVDQPLTKEEKGTVVWLAQLERLGSLDEEERLLRNLLEIATPTSKRIGKICSCYLQVLVEEGAYPEEKEIEEGHLEKKGEEEGVQTDQTHPLEKSGKVEVTFYKVEALKDPREPPTLEEETEPVTEPSPHDRDLSSQQDVLRPHVRGLGVRQTTPPPHSRHSSVRRSHASHLDQDLPPPHSEALGVRPTASLPHGRDSSPRPLTVSLPSCHDKISSPLATTRLDRDKLQGDDNQKLYGKEEPSFMETCYTTANLQPQALQDQEAKLTKREREAKGPRPKDIERIGHASFHGEVTLEVSDANTRPNIRASIEFYEGRKTLGAIEHPKSKEWTYGEPFSGKQTHLVEDTNEDHLGSFSRKDAEISNPLIDEEDEKGPGDVYLGMTTQAPQEEFCRNIVFRRIRERREAPDQCSYRLRPPPIFYHPYKDHGPVLKFRPSRYHPSDPQTVGCDQNFFDRGRVSLRLRHQPLQDKTDGIPRHRSQGERLENPKKMCLRVAGHDDTKKQEKEPDPHVISDHKIYHGSHPLRALEEGEIYDEEGDPPYEIIEGELEGLNKARPKEACRMTDSPSV